VGKESADGCDGLPAVTKIKYDNLDMKKNPENNKNV
jgi:hypothetical protein